MPAIAKLIGGAGTGKTTELLQTMERAIEAGGYSPEQVGFVSFTRAARHEAASRAADKFGCKQDDLERHGWFRTLHSIAFRCLGVNGELIADDKDGREWLRTALGEDATCEPKAEQDISEISDSQESDTSKSLRLWSLARSRLESLDATYDDVSAFTEYMPERDYCRDVVHRYEQRKLMDNRCDFVDLAGRFSGWRFSLAGASKCDPQGEVPHVPVWVVDEAQDISPLLADVVHRLLSSPTCHWAYLAGDPFQEIHSFGGADHRCFLEWPASKQKTMPQSWRCPAPIFDLGEQILSGCSDYFDRGIKPAAHDGDWMECDTWELPMSEVNPADSWLFLARTNRQARMFMARLEDEGIPWVPTKGNGGWARPALNEAMKALLDLEQGHPIDVDQWRRVLDFVPSNAEGQALLVRGTKTQWADRSVEPPGLGAMVDPPAGAAHSRIVDLALFGATPALIEAIRCGVWRRLIPQATAFAAAVERWGIDAVMKPKVAAGTVHSVKGAEADNVVLLATLTGPSARSVVTQDGEDAERRLAYVGVTRARQRLWIVKERKKASFPGL
jgi:superfamily I DNA/RNA helicase